VTTLITEPKSGNLLLAGMANGRVKLYDLRSAKGTAVLQYQGDEGYSGAGACAAARGVKKIGIFLGESRHITSAWCDLSGRSGSHVHVLILSVPTV
jgi:regulator-associated protein of mTOR